MNQQPEDDRLTSLALDYFDRLEREGPEAMDAISAEHPAEAEELKRIVGHLKRVGLVGAEPALHFTTDSPLGPEQRLGQFRILKLLGGGGMGLVYLAEQEDLGRKVALKLMRPGVLDSSRSRKRFSREIALLSRLDHAGICTVYEAGSIDGKPYMAMRYIEGESLATRLRTLRNAAAEKPISGSESASHVRESVALIEKVARALHTAHEAGVVHRDIKPGNIMIDAEHQPVLLDFGLARREEEDEGEAALTRSGDEVGTPAYMAPEQIRGKHVDRRTDVYALGVTLYEALTLCCPFAGATRDHLYRQILSGEVQDPRRHCRQIDKELRLVLERAMALEPSDRYASAREFANELGRILRHEPILTRRPALSLRLYRWSQRNPAAATALVVVTAALVVSLYLLLDNIRLSKHRTAIALAMAAENRVQQNPVLAFQLAREAIRRTNDPIVVEQLQAVMGHLHELKCLRDHGGGITRRALFSPDGKLLVTAAEDGTSPPALYDAAGNRKTRLALPWASRRGIAFAPKGPFADGSYVAVGGRHEEMAVVRLFDHDGKHIRDLQHATSAERPLVWCVRFSPDGEKLLACGSNGTASLWRTRDWERLTVLAGGHRGVISDCAFSANGEHIITAGGFGVSLVTDQSQQTYDICIWTAKGELLEPSPLKGHAHTIWTIAAGKHRFATASHDGTLRFWTYTGQEKAVYRGEEFGSVQANRSGDQFVATSLSGWVSLFDFTGAEIRKWKLSGSVAWAEFSPDGRFIVTGAWNQLVQVWDLEGNEIARMRGHLNGVTHASFSPDGTRIASASFDGTVRLWQLHPLGIHIRHMDVTGVRHVLPFGDGVHMLASGWKSGRVWIFKNQEELPVDSQRIDGLCTGASRSLEGSELVLSYSKGPTQGQGEVRIYRASPEIHMEKFGLDLPVSAAVVHPTERSLILASRNILYRLDRTTSQPRPEPWSQEPTQDQIPWITTLTLSPPDGKYLLTGHQSGECRLWDVQTRRMLTPRFEGHKSYIRSCAFSADGNQILTASEDSTARLWDVGTRIELKVFEGHQGAVLRACFSPDKESILTASNDDTLRLWDRQTGNLILELRRHRRDVRAACFTADGKQVISGSLDGTIRWWWLDPADLRKVAQGLDIPELTDEQKQRGRLRELFGR